MNVQEVLNISKERKSRLKEVIKKIIENIHKRILYYANLKHESCNYMIPPLIDDTPLYDREYITKEVYSVLDNEGYIVSAYSNGQIEISWNEVLVSQKIKTDARLLKEQEAKLNKLSKRSKLLNERYSILANPKKTTKEISIDDQLDNQVEKILKEKEKMQKKFKSAVGNFNKI
jgi:hypothetical protein